MPQPHETVLNRLRDTSGQEVTAPPLKHPTRNLSQEAGPTEGSAYEEMCLGVLSGYASLHWTRGEGGVISVIDESGQWPDPAEMRLASFDTLYRVCAMVREPGGECFRFLTVWDNRQYSNPSLALNTISMRFPEGMISLDVWGSRYPCFTLLSEEQTLPPFLRIMFQQGAAVITSPLDNGFPWMRVSFDGRDFHFEYEEQGGGVEPAKITVKPERDQVIKWLPREWSKGACCQVLVSNEGNECASLAYVPTGGSHAVMLKLRAEQMALDWNGVVQRAIWQPEVLASMIESFEYDLS